MKLKSAQISIFIIIAIIIIFSFIFIFNTSSKNLENINDKDNINVNSINLNQVSKSVSEYVESCIEKIGNEGVYKISANGGYLSSGGNSRYNEPGDGKFHFSEYYYFENSKISYIIDRDKSNLRPIKKIEDILENYIIVELNSCLLDFSSYREQGYNFIYDNLTLEKNKDDIVVKIDDEKINIDLDFMISITKDDTISNIDTFGATLSLRFGKIYNIALDLIDGIISSNPYDITSNCENLLTDDGMTNIYLESNPYTYVYLIRIVDISSYPSKLPLRFHMAIKNREIGGGCYE